MPQAMRPVGVIGETVGVADETFLEPSVAGVSWAAVAAGAVACCALTLVLLSLGAGLGFSVVSPWANSGVSATTFQIGTGLYFIVMAMISSAVGGYLAGRLRNRWIGVESTEVVFRDTAHGFRAWALVRRSLIRAALGIARVARPPMPWPKSGAKWRLETSGSSVLGAILLASPATSLLSSATSGAT
jgi:hypothetical protein